MQDKSAIEIMQQSRRERTSTGPGDVVPEVKEQNDTFFTGVSGFNTETCAVKKLPAVLVPKPKFSSFYTSFSVALAWTKRTPGKGKITDAL